MLLVHPGNFLSDRLGVEVLGAGLAEVGFELLQRGRLRRDSVRRHLGPGDPNQ